MRIDDSYFNKSPGERAADFIRKQVEECGSQTAVARRIKVAAPSINRYCSGDSTPNMETILKIAAAYGKPLSFFTGEEMTVNEPKAETYLTSQEEALLKLLRGDPELLSDVVKYTEKEKFYREMMAEKKKVNG